MGLGAPIVGPLPGTPTSPGGADPGHVGGAGETDAFLLGDQPIEPVQRIDSGDTTPSPGPHLTHGDDPERLVWTANAPATQADGAAPAPPSHERDTSLVSRPELQTRVTLMRSVAIDPATGPGMTVARLVGDRQGLVLPVGPTRRHFDGGGVNPGDVSGQVVGGTHRYEPGASERSVGQSVAGPGTAGTTAGGVTGGGDLAVQRLTTPAAAHVGTVVRSALTTGAPVSTVDGATTVQLVVAGPAPAAEAGTGVVWQRQEADAAPIPEPPTTPADTTPPQAATTAAAPNAAPAAATEPDELVKKLFDPLLRRLKAELRLDRERRGVLTDLRH